MKLYLCTLMLALAGCAVGGPEPGSIAWWHERNSHNGRITEPSKW